jgi:hypothetical protein
VAAGPDTHRAQSGPRRDVGGADPARPDPQERHRPTARKANEVAHLQPLNPAGALGG